MKRTDNSKSREKNDLKLMVNFFFTREHGKIKEHLLACLYIIDYHLYVCLFLLEKSEGKRVKIVMGILMELYDKDSHSGEKNGLVENIIWVKIPLNLNQNSIVGKVAMKNNKMSLSYTKETTTATAYDHVPGE